MSTPIPVMRSNALLAALSLGASLALTAVSAPAAPLDDTYIHLVFGRNLARGGFMQFNPGTPSTGLTSPVWVLPSAAASLAGSAAPALLMGISSAAGALAVLAGGEAALHQLQRLRALGQRGTTLDIALSPLITPEQGARCK